MKIKLAFVISLIMASHVFAGEPVRTSNIIKTHAPIIAQPAVWEPADAVYSPWDSISNLYDCSEWQPRSEDIDVGQSFVQTSTCKVEQERTRQDREYDPESNRYRNTGLLVTEYRTLDSQQKSQNSIGTKMICKYGSDNSWLDTFGIVYLKVNGVIISAYEDKSGYARGKYMESNMAGDFYEVCFL